ncbi:hypothetical protein FOMG_15574 [Fusarium oxysporum f. sp. melonis 26406]|uniref:Uncharacterized protein n=1 Tax=Fusarium oxysporum f. sp. melonis 26406 TaxID=1089452 RepID=X0A4F6_FUSOX|nr:hypothetical protein FOMG_15574 [Fusarium oxysporum f. sp. melonis 26406]
MPPNMHILPSETLDIGIADGQVMHASQQYHVWRSNNNS